MDERIWKDCVRFNQYEISSYGEIRHKRTGRIRKPIANNRDGYPQITMWNKSKCSVKTTKIHSLVAETFIGPRPVDKDVRHLDGDRTNNHISNLAYGTIAENFQDMERHKTIIRGENSKMCRISDADVIEMRRLHATGQYSQRKLAKMYNLSYTHAVNIIKRKHRKLLTNEFKTFEATT